MRLPGIRLVGIRHVGGALAQEEYDERFGRLVVQGVDCYDPGSPRLRIFFGPEMGKPDTVIGRGGSAFPPTRWSVIRDSADPASDTHRESLEILARIYWRPVYAYLRRKWGMSNEEAKDLTQDFFVTLAEREMLQRLSPERGKFRSYVMGAMDNFVRLQFRRDSAQKRGGHLRRVPLDTGEGFEPSSSEPPEQAFVREWTTALLQDALREMEEDYRARQAYSQYEIFVLREVDPPAEGPPSYEALAEKFGMSVSDVRNYLYRARKNLRRIVLNRIRDTVTEERDVEEEMKDLFGRWEE